MSKTHWKSLGNPNYLGAYALVDSATGGYKDIVATIASVKQENVTGTDGKREDCRIMRFVESNIKPMIVNETNSKTLEKVLKTPFIEEWAGRKIQIGVESVKSFGDVVDALRIRKFLPQVTGTVKCSKCGGDIAATEKLSAAQMVAYSQKRYGQSLCAACMRELHDAQANTEPEDTAPAQEESDVPDQEDENEQL